jgi:FkbM family methyltransferase
MKRWLVGTRLGRLALSVRESVALAAAAITRAEAVGTLANDHLASFLVVRLCRPQTTFIDVGAHIGSVIAEVTAHCPAARIIAVEAIPEKADRLRRRFPKVEVHACAVGEAVGEASFFIDTRRSGYSSLGRPADKTGVREFRVHVRALDGLGAANVDVIKIDVEGAELGVLRGGDRVITGDRPTVMFESGPPAENGLAYTKDALWQWFADRDYAVLVPNRVAHDDPGLSREGFAESHLYPRRTTNYFAVAAERRIELRDRARAILNIRVT